MSDKRDKRDKRDKSDKRDKRDKRDLSKTCNDQGIPQQDFDLICQVCRNSECTRAGAVETPWTRRMKEQVDKLLINPRFADHENPKYAHLAPLPSVPPKQWPTSVSLTTAPRGGIMVGGGKPEEAPEKDPWAVPKKPKNLVKVGATIKMGDDS